MFVDSKTHLQEIIQKNSDHSVDYVIASEKGPDHSKLFFEVVATHQGEAIGHGFGRSKKAAEQEAAFDAIKKL